MAPARRRRRRPPRRSRSRPASIVSSPCIPQIWRDGLSPDQVPRLARATDRGGDSIVHATQFFEFIKSIAAAGTEGNTVHLAPVLIQPMAADDVAKAVATIAVGAPVNGVVEIAGPEQFRLDELVREGLAAQQDPREVVADPRATYFGAILSARTLVPGDGARLGEIHFREWLGQPALQQR